MLRSIDCPDFDCAIYDTCGKIENIRCQCLAEFFIAVLNVRVMFVRKNLVVKKIYLMN